MADKIKRMEELPPHNDLVAFLATIQAFDVLANELIKVADNYKLPISFKIFIGDWVAPLRAAAKTAETLLKKLEAS